MGSPFGRLSPYRNATTRSAPTTGARKLSDGHWPPSRSTTDLFPASSGHFPFRDVRDSATSRNDDGFDRSTAIERTISSADPSVLSTPSCPQVKGFGIINKAEVDVFLELSCFFCDPTDVGNFNSRSFAFSKSSLNIWKFTV